MSNLNIDGVFEVLTIIAWIITIYLLVRALVRSVQRYGIKTTVTRRTGWLLSRNFVIAFVTSVVLTLISMAIVFIQPQESGAVVSVVSPNGIRSRPLGAGLHLVIPFLERVQRYPLYLQTYTISNTDLERGRVDSDDSIAARTQDGQEVFFDSSVIFRINPDMVNEVHIFWQDRYLEDLVRPLVRGAIRDAASQFQVQEIYSERRFELTQERVTNLLQTPLEENGLILDQFILRNITFPPEYAASIERKQIAEQEALKAEIEIQTKANQAEQIRQLAQGEADAVVIKAQADAEALRLVTLVLQENPDLLNYEYIKKLAPNVQLMLVPNNAPVILPIPGAGMGQAGEQGQTLPNPLLPQLPPSALANDGGTTLLDTAVPTQTVTAPSAEPTAEP
jgi:regulator of protease activity HflC (stomatin/prohibitin superfamily)